MEPEIQRVELQAEKEPHATRYRVRVILDDNPPRETAVATPVATPGQQESPANATRDATPTLTEIDACREVVKIEEQLKSAQDRAKSLEELPGFHRQALKDADWRYHEILMELRQCQQNLAAVTRALPHQTCIYQYALPKAPPQLKSKDPRG